MRGDVLDFWYCSCVFRIRMRAADMLGPLLANTANQCCCDVRLRFSVVESSEYRVATDHNRSCTFHTAAVEVSVFL